MSRDTSLGEALTALLEDRDGQMAVVVPGKVATWNSLTETVTVAVQLSARDGSSRGEVQQCPVVFPGAYWDIQVGETGFLIACDEDFSTWWRTGQVSPPTTRQVHRIGNAIFLPGFRTSTDARTHAMGAAILDKPVALGEVLLGDPAATKAALHEDLLADLGTLLTNLDNWGTTAHANFAASVVFWIANVQPQITTLSVGIAAGTYQSPSVKVEN